MKLSHMVATGLVHCNLFRLAAAKSLQSCPTLCDPIDSSPPGFPVPGILQAKTLEWVSAVWDYLKDTEFGAVFILLLVSSTMLD